MSYADELVADALRASMVKRRRRVLDDQVRERFERMEINARLPRSKWTCDMWKRYNDDMARRAS